MKKLLLAVAPLALLVAVPALAADARGPFAPPAPPPPAPLFGVVLEGWGGGSWVGQQVDNVSVDHDHLTNFGGSARLGLALPGQFSVQFDGAGEWTNNDKGTDNFDNWAIGGVHFGLRNNDGLVGVFGGGGYGTSEGDRQNSWFAGVEGQAYLGDLTFLAQAGYFDARPQFETIYHAGFGRLVARYFIGANTSIQAEGSLLYGKQDSDPQSGRAFGWGVRVDHQLPIYPGAATGVFLAYRGGAFESYDGAGDDGRMLDHTIMGGVRIGLGSAGTDLRTNDRRGVSLDLPDFGRWTGAGAIID